MIGEAVGGVKFVAGRRHAGRRDGRRRESIEIYGHGWKQNGRDGGRHGLAVLLDMAVYLCFLSGFLDRGVYFCFLSPT